jgi:hypothetical protein
VLSDNSELGSSGKERNNRFRKFISQRWRILYIA